MAQIKTSFHMFTHTCNHKLAVYGLVGGLELSLIDVYGHFVAGS